MEFTFEIEGLSVISPNDPIKVNNIITTIYGQPGVGKTSFGFTSESCLMFDFDGGVHRSINRKHALRFANTYNQHGKLEKTSYEQCMNAILEGDLLGQFKNQGGKTIIIDTAGTLLDDSITPYLIKKNNKLRNSAGGLTLHGYSALKTEFNNFLSIIKSYELDIVFICHAKEKEDYVRPKMTGGSLDILKEKTDIMGFMFKDESGRVTVQFTPTDRSFGKDAGNLGKVIVPHYEKEADKYFDFLARLIQRSKDRMTEMTKEQKNALAIAEDYKTRASKLDNISDLETLHKEVQGSSMGSTVRAQVNHSIASMCADIFTDHLKDVQKVTDKNIKILNQKVKDLEGLPDVILRACWKVVKECADGLELEYDKDNRRFIKPAVKEDQTKAEQPADAKD